MAEPNDDTPFHPPGATTPAGPGPAYGGPHPQQGSPPPAYGAAPPAYGGPPPGYGGPPPEYGGPPPGYGSGADPPPGYPAGGYQPGGYGDGSGYTYGVGYGGYGSGYGQPGYGYPGYGYPAYAGPRNETMALLSLIFSLVAWPLCVGYGIGIVASVAAVVLGFLGKKKIRDSGGMLTGDGMALAGIIVGFVNIALFIGVIIWFIVAISSATTYSS